MRRGELLGLRWRDVHDGWIEVMESLDTTRNLVAPKTNGSRRRIDVYPALNRILKQVRGASDAFVFQTANGTSLSPRNVLRDFRAAIAVANKAEAETAGHAGREAVVIPSIRFHDLRHTHATMLLRANVHPKVVSERLGHASVRMTLDVYSHAVPTMQTQAAAIAATMLGVAGPTAKRAHFREKMPKNDAPADLPLACREFACKGSGVRISSSPPFGLGLRRMLRKASRALSDPPWNP